MISDNYITDKKAFITSLFEEAFRAPVDKVLGNWNQYISYFFDGAITNMLAAYKYAQSCKEELPFYSFMCFWLACHDMYQRWHKVAYYEEALKYCRQLDLKTDIELNYQLVKAESEKSSFEGLHPSAAHRINGIEKITAVYGHDDWTLHDAEIKNMVYDRDKDILDIEVDTFIPDWATDKRCHIIPFHFSNILSIEADMDYGNDYFSTCHIYSENDYIYVEFESAHIKICSRELSIGDIK